MAYVQGKGGSFAGRRTLVPPGSATDREGMGRQWKQPKKNGASAVQVIRKGTISEQREREKKIKKAYKERMTELKEEIRLNKVEKRKKREEREEKKQKNILRSGTKLQRMTNPKTSKEIAKSKQRKLLKVVSDDMLKQYFCSNFKEAIHIAILLEIDESFEWKIIGHYKNGLKRCC